jgi:hypothetical protein
MVEVMVLNYCRDHHIPLGPSTGTGTGKPAAGKRRKG